MTNFYQVVITVALLTLSTGCHLSIGAQNIQLPNEFGAAKNLVNAGRNYIQGQVPTKRDSSSANVGQQQFGGNQDLGRSPINGVQNFNMNKPMQQVPSHVDAMMNNMGLYGPPSGTNLNVNNQVSNIKMGNVKSNNIIMPGASAQAAPGGQAMFTPSSQKPSVTQMQSKSGVKLVSSNGATPVTTDSSRAALIEGEMFGRSGDLSQAMRNQRGYNAGTFDQNSSPQQQRQEQLQSSMPMSGLNNNPDSAVYQQLSGVRDPSEQYVSREFYDKSGPSRQLNQPQPQPQQQHQQQQQSEAPLGWNEEPKAPSGWRQHSSTYQGVIQNNGETKKVKATSEQHELKSKLLDLASKATAAAPGADDDAPLLKLNKETGKFELVEVDPNASAYKEKLHEALNALSAKKISKKVKRVLMGEDEQSYQYEKKLRKEHEEKNKADRFEQPDYYYPGSVLEKQARNNNNNNNKPSRYGEEMVQNRGLKSSDESEFQNQFDYRGPFETEYNQADYDGRPGYESADLVERVGEPTQEYLEEEENYRRSSLPVYREEQDYASRSLPTDSEGDEERANMVNQVRETLEDRLNRVSDLLYFRPEFIHELVSIDDSRELTPVESEFKRMILCVSDEQFCTQDQLNRGINRRQRESRQPTSEMFYDEQQQPVDDEQQYYMEEQNNQRQHPEGLQLDEGYSSLPAGYPQDGGYNGFDETAPSDGHYRRRSSKNSYVYEHSTESARSGQPVQRQGNQYAEHSSFMSTNNGPAVAMTSVHVGSTDSNGSPSSQHHYQHSVVGPYEGISSVASVGSQSIPAARVASAAAAAGMMQPMSSNLPSSGGRQVVAASLQPTSSQGRPAQQQQARFQQMPSGAQRFY